jgi:hypothetical protein
MQYDLRLSGVQYDILPQSDDMHGQGRYAMRPFQLYMKSKRFKMHFAAVFQVRVVKKYIHRLSLFDFRSRIFCC